MKDQAERQIEAEVGMKADYDTDGTDGCLVTDLGGQHTDLDNEGSAG